MNINITLAIVMLILAVINSIIHDKSKLARAGMVFCCSAAAMIWTLDYYEDYGAFGRPFSLNETTYYHVLSVTPLGDKSTAVILRNGEGKTVPIEFTTPVVADTNGLYTVVSSNDGYNLVLVK